MRWIIYFMSWLVIIPPAIHNWSNAHIWKQIFCCVVDHSRNTITYHNALCLSTQNFCKSIVLSFSRELKWPQEKLKTTLTKNFGVTKKSIMVCYGIFWSGQLSRNYHRRSHFNTGAVWAPNRSSYFSIYCPFNI